LRRVGNDWDVANPFVYEEAVQPQDLIDREEQAKQLLRRLGEGRNTRLAAPRRYGKTSLLRKVLEDAARRDLVPVYVNFLGVLTAADVAGRIELAYREQLDSPLRRWFDGLVRTWRPTVGAAAPGIQISASVSSSTMEETLLERQSVPRKLFHKHGRSCAIVFDEFQDVMAAGDNVDAVMRSELEQQGSAAAYVFSGSKPGMMRQLFSDRRRGFYAQAGQIDLPLLSPQDLAEYIGGRFEDHRRDVGEALGPLLDAAQGHPQRAMLLASHLYERTAAGTAADTDTWTAALRSACLEVDGEIEEAWRGLTRTEQRIAALVADGHIQLGSKEAEFRFGVVHSGTNRQTAERMADEAVIVPDQGTASGWKVVDPLFGLWLRSGRRWPPEVG
jgi:hypothetical protein